MELWTIEGAAALLVFTAWWVQVLSWLYFAECNARMKGSKIQDPQLTVQWRQQGFQLGIFGVASIVGGGFAGLGTSLFWSGGGPTLANALPAFVFVSFGALIVLVATIYVQTRTVRSESGLVDNPGRLLRYLSDSRTKPTTAEELGEVRAVRQRIKKLLPSSGVTSPRDREHYLDAVLPTARGEWSVRPRGRSCACVSAHRHDTWRARRGFLRALARDTDARTVLVFLHRCSVRSRVVLACLALVHCIGVLALGFAVLDGVWRIGAEYRRLETVLLLALTVLVPSGALLGWLGARQWTVHENRLAAQSKALLDECDRLIGSLREQVGVQERPETRHEHADHSTDATRQPSALHARGVDPRDIRWEDDEPVFRVYFWESPQVEGIGHNSDEYELTGADVNAVMVWARHHAGDDRSYTIHLVVHTPSLGKGMVTLAGADPNEGDTSVAWLTWISDEDEDEVAE